jgi:hypothetical protein
MALPLLLFLRTIQEPIFNNFIVYIFMAKQTSFAHQRDVLEQFLSLLTGFENEFKSLIENFDGRITSLYEDQGLMEEIYEDYQATYLNSLNATLADIKTRIHEEDIPFIEKEIDFISSH